MLTVEDLQEWFQAFTNALLRYFCDVPLVPPLSQLLVALHLVIIIIKGAHQDIPQCPQLQLLVVLLVAIIKIIIIIIIIIKEGNDNNLGGSSGYTTVPFYSTATSNNNNSILGSSSGDPTVPCTAG